MSTIVVSGTSGLVGSALVTALEKRGDVVRRLVRQSGSGADEIVWDPIEKKVDGAQLEGVDAVVHLAGETIGQRWTHATRQRIEKSRSEGTRLVAETLAGLKAPPRALVCASAIGIYGDRGEEMLDELSSSGEGFLAHVVKEWEAATGPSIAVGIRVVNARFGLVLSKNGGGLARMLTPFRLGLGGPIGSGRQLQSWIALEDCVRALLFAVDNAAVRGPINVVAPQPVTQREFARTLGRVLHRAAVIPLPALAVHAMFGEMGRELLLASQRVIPRKLSEAGFRFEYGELETALRAALS